MKKRTLRKSNLDELAQVMPVLNEKVQQKFVGGGDGSANCPYTVYEYDWMSGSGSWNGGYVEGMGYVLAEVTVTGSYSAGCQETTYNGLGSFVETIEAHTNKNQEDICFVVIPFIFQLSLDFPNVNFEFESFNLISI